MDIKNMNTKELDDKLDHIIASDVLMSSIYWSIVFIITKFRMWA